MYKFEGKYSNHENNNFEIQARVLRAYISDLLKPRRYFHEYNTLYIYVYVSVGMTVK